MNNEDEDKDAEDVKSGKNTRKGAKSRGAARNNRKVKGGGHGMSLTDTKRLYPDLQGAIPQVMSGGYVSTLLTTVSHDLSVLGIVERNCYIVNVQALIDVFHEIETFVRSLNRRGGWKHEWYYVGLWLRRLAGRLQRIGNATEQYVSDPSTLIPLAGQCPLIVAFMINQFGIAEDKHTKSVLYPRVTENLIKYMAGYGKKMMAGPLVPHIAELTQVASHASYVEHCYGVALQENLLLARHFSRLQTPFQVSLDANIRRQSIANSVNYYRRTHGNGALTGAQWVNIGQDGGGNPLLAESTAGTAGGGIGAIAGVLAVILNQFNLNATDYCSALDLAGHHPLPGNLATERAHQDQMVVEVEDMEIKARFVCGSVSASPEGSWAPVVRAVNVETDVSGTVGILGVTVQEYLIGILLNQYVTSINRDDLPFNWSAIGRQHDKFSIPPLGYSRQELLAKVVRECLVRRNG